ncbi:hypothetical protein OHT93_09220 [Streptomyces sp. NBC_00191]|uniref:hypothetical protein n=1 Tax=Streptomyces sp. NBC_00191 TaxID=2975674 RepID=UPI003255C5D2
MSHQYPGPQQPYQGGPAPYQPPPPPKKRMSPWAIVAITLGGIFAFLIVVSIALGGTDTDKTTARKSTPAATPQKTAPVTPTEKKQPAKAPAKELSPADQFKAFVAKNGSAEEKAAVKHVTKVQGADDQNDIADTADVYTDFSGGLVGPHQGEGKLIASAFADWRTSKNGLVTIYDKDGQLLSNGNF